MKQWFVMPRTWVQFPTWIKCVKQLQVSPARIFVIAKIAVELLSIMDERCFSRLFHFHSDMYAFECVTACISPYSDTL